MNDSIRFLEDIQSSFNKMKLLTFTAFALAGVVALGAVGMAFWYATQQREQIYVIDQGSVLIANRTENAAQRDLEVISHVTRFHELFYNNPPNINAINTNVDKAFDLADASARSYYNELKESKFYSTLIQRNMMQSILVDSVKVDMSRKPYHAVTYATRMIIRETNMSSYKMVTSCDVIESVRSPKNPNGLLITKFNLESDVLDKTRGRR